MVPTSEKSGEPNERDSHELSIKTNGDNKPSRRESHGFLKRKNTTVAPGGPVTSAESAKRRASLQRYPIIEKMPLRHRLWMTMEDPKFSLNAKIWSIFMLGVIFISTMTFCLETEYPEHHAVFGVIEFVAVIIFSIEFILRLLTTPNVLIFTFNVLNLVDFIAILPFWLGLMISDFNSGFTVFRVIRMVRVFRIFKVGKTSTGIKMVLGTLGVSLEVLGILVFLMLIAMVVFGAAIYYAEHDGPNAGMFPTIPQSFWWCLVTMTTVGYGDTYPDTPFGKVVATLCMMTGILILAMPITVIGNNFTKLHDMHVYYVEVLAKCDPNGDGAIDADELKEFMQAQHARGNLLIDPSTDPQALINIYDVSQTGKLDSDTFGLLVSDIVKDPSNVTAGTIEKICDDVVDLTKNLGKMDKKLNAHVQQTNDQLAQMQATLAVLAESMQILAGNTGGGSALPVIKAAQVGATPVTSNTPVAAAATSQSMPSKLQIDASKEAEPQKPLDNSNTRRASNAAQGLLGGIGLGAIGIGNSPPNPSLTA